MKLNKLKNTKQNLIFGFAQKIFQLLLSFIFRSIIVHALGVQYLGLNGLFSSVLLVLNLAELGVGSAMVFSMYKPIAEDDSSKLCALMRLYRLYYRIIGAIILVVGLLLTPAIPHLISGEVPIDINVYILYLLHLGATVLTYWLFAYKNSILEAHQQRSVISKVTLATDAVKYLLQLIALVVFRNYYFYVLSLLFSQALCNIVAAIISHKLYPQYRAQGDLSKAERKAITRRISDLFTTKLGSVIVSSADTLAISSALGLNALAIYQNYFYLIRAARSFITIINASVLAGIGNSMLTKNEQENYKDFRSFIFIEFWIFGFCVCCFSALVQPFITLWMGKELVLTYPFVIMLCLYFLSYEYVMAMSVYKDACGIWHQDRFRPLVCGLAELVLCFIFVRYLGLIGIILAIFLSNSLIGAPWITQNVFHYIFKHESLSGHLRDISLYLCVIAVIAVIVNLLCGLIPGAGIVSFIFKFLVSVLLSNGLFVLAYFKHPCFKESIYLANRMIRTVKQN